MKAEKSNIENNAGEMNKFRLALDQVPSAIFIMDKDWNFEYINPEFERLSGFMREELLHKNIRDTLYKNISGIPESRRGIITNLYEGKSWKGELLTVAKDGSKYWAETTASPYKNEKDEVDGYIVIQHDVTDKKNLEKSISESENKYRTLVEYSQDGIAIVQDGHFRFVNNAMCKVLGYSPQEFYEMNGNEILHPSCRETILDIHQRRMAGEVSSINYSMQLITKDGRVIDVEAQSSTFNYESRPAGYLTIHDVTESQRMQEALLRSERRFRELTEMLPQAIYELDANNHPLFMNRAGLNMFGLAPGASQSKKAFEFFSPEDTKKMKEALDRESKNIRYENGLLQPFASEPAEYMANKTDGSTFPVIVYGTPIVENGLVTGSRGIIVDISERKAMENALRESEKKYKTLVENSLDGIMIVKNNRILFANDTYCKMLGYDCKFISKSFATDFIVPDEQDRALALSERRLNGDKSTIRDCYRLMRSDEKIIECEAYSSVINYEGEIASFFTIHDVTENRRMQKALEESEEKYRSFIEKATDGIVITQDGKLRFSNEAMHEMMQYSEEEMLEKSFLEFVIPEDHEEMLQYHKRRMAGEKFNVLYRSHFIRKDRKIITVELNARTLDFNGRPAAFIVIRDITERLIIEDELKLAKDELEELNKNLEERIKESSDNLTEARTQLIRLQKENLQSQFEVLRQQVNPHFLFNSLNVLTSLIKLEPDLAEKFTEHLSKVYRYVLENKDNDLVDLKTELDFLDAYLFLLNIRFMGKIAVTINIGNDKTEMLILPLALQLLIENAIKHNSMSKKAPLRIDLFIDENNFLNVVNNLQERESYIASTGVGLKNIEHRYQLLEMPAPEFIKTGKTFIAKVPLKEPKIL